jgi:hypothetical protein
VTYPALLREGRLEWTDEVPDNLPAVSRVQVTFLESPSTTSRGQAMAAALTRLADMGGPSFPADLEAWQRETREDRPLPGRSS